MRARVADGEAQVVGGEAGEGGARANRDALLAQVPRRRAALAELHEHEVRGPRVDGGAGDLGEVPEEVRRVAGDARVAALPRVDST